MPPSEHLNGSMWRTDVILRCVLWFKGNVSPICKSRFLSFFFFYNYIFFLLFCRWEIWTFFSHSGVLKSEIFPNFFLKICKFIRLWFLSCCCFIYFLFFYSGNNISLTNVPFWIVFFIFWKLLQLYNYNQIITFIKSEKI